jgi:hypothetical protein
MDYSDRIKSWFKNHVCEYSSVGDVETIVWGKAGDAINRIIYIFCGDIKTLFVTGDLGSAVYRFNTSSISEIAKAATYYFAEKCEASEVGKGFQCWDEEKALEVIDRFAAGLDEDKQQKYIGLVNDDNFPELTSQEEWRMWLMSEANEVFLDDDMAELMDAGMAAHIRCQAHLIGLSMAMEYIHFA